MLKWIETTGKTERDALNKALKELGLEDDDVSIEVITRAKTGFLGIGSCPAKIRVTYEVPDEPAPVVEEPVAEPEAPAEAVAEPEPVEEPTPASAAEPEPAEAPAETPVMEAEPERKEKIETFLTGLLERLEVPAEIKLQVNEAGIYQVELVGKNLGALIGVTIGRQLVEGLHAVNFQFLGLTFVDKQVLVLIVGVVMALTAVIVYFLRRGVKEEA